jgi:N-acetyl-anhydromuramyl-L-alanine amidase AmpD
MEGTLRGTDAWFNDPRSKVSSHYGIGKAGEVHQYVREADSAYHAGRVYKPTWKGVRPGLSPNLYTLGIEHEGFAADVWPEAMVSASAALIRELCERWSVPIDRAHVIGHREIYAHKTCPGTGVDLDRLVELARGHQAPPRAPSGPYNFVPDTGTVTALVSLNVREAPTAEADRVRTLAAGNSVGVAGWTSNGQTVNGNAHWYRLSDGQYVWAGGTGAPIPGLGR